MPSEPASLARARGIFLVGFMGAGKSSVGRALGQQLNWAFEDLDHRIERREGRTVAEIFRDSGETAFRKAERAALEQVLLELRGGAARVIALGGGAFVQKGNATKLKRSGMLTIFLDAPVEELWRRCSEQASEVVTERPLLKSLAEFRRLYQARRKTYLTASMSIDTARRTVEAIAAGIAETVGHATIPMRTEEGEVE